LSDLVLDASRVSIRQGSKSFAAAARLFDPTVREDAYLLYAWCRHCDDEIDGQVLGHGSVGLDPRLAAAKLAELEDKTRRALAGQGVEDDQAFAAFQRVAQRHTIPSRLPLELLEGFRMDVEGRAYSTLDDVLLYAYRVAGVVGEMMARVMGAVDSDILRRAVDLGLALQLTNIARDVVEDARGGRIYLPSEWLGPLAGGRGGGPGEWGRGVRGDRPADRRGGALLSVRPLGSLRARFSLGLGGGGGGRRLSPDRAARAEGRPRRP
jgi:phytoene synthase